MRAIATKTGARPSPATQCTAMAGPSEPLGPELSGASWNVVCTSSSHLWMISGGGAPPSSYSISSSCWQAPSARGSRGRGATGLNAISKAFFSLQGWFPTCALVRDASPLTCSQQTRDCGARSLHLSHDTPLLYTPCPYAAGSIIPPVTEPMLHMSLG